MKYLKMKCQALESEAELSWCWQIVGYKPTIETSKKNLTFKKIKISKYLGSNLGSATEESQNHQVNIDNYVKVTIIIKNNKMLYRYKLPMRIQTEQNKRKRIQEEFI